MNDLVASLPRWFLIELKPDELYIEPTEASARTFFLDSALTRLRNPEVSFFPLSNQQLLIHIHCPDALIDIRVESANVSIMVQVIGDMEGPIRFCENMDALVYGDQRVRSLPSGTISPFGSRPSGTLFGRVLEQTQSDYQTFTLTDHPFYGRALMLDDAIQFGDRDEKLYSDSLVSHALPEDVDSVLILGGGDCGVLREVLIRKVKRVIMFELDRHVVEFCKEHFPSVVGRSTEDQRVEIQFGDAFKFLETTSETFDVVISDLLDAPISNLGLDQQVGLMKRVVKKGGRLATHAEFKEMDDPSHQTEPMIEAFNHHFEDVEIIEKRIPSFQDQTWLFVRGVCCDSEGHSK
ncbi:MAG: hypothetical protein AAF558_07035 [Verrucomicrobiota bacterium]